MQKHDLFDGLAVKLANPDKPIAVETEASIHDVGAVLLKSEVEEEYSTIRVQVSSDCCATLLLAI